MAADGVRRAVLACAALTLLGGAALAAVRVTHPSLAELRPDTQMQVHLSPRPDGTVSIAVEKRYTGRAGPVEDVIALPSPSAGGYPSVRVIASPGYRFVQEPGRVVIRSDGVAPGTVSIYVTDLGNRAGGRFSYVWWLQSPEAGGVGTTRADVTVALPEGLMIDMRENGLRIFGERERSVRPVVNGGSWQASADLSQGEMGVVSIWFSRRPPLMPEWAILVALGMMILALWALRRLARSEEPA
jgi:hypothetical protein